MRNCVQLLLILTATVLARGASAQTLSENLIAEDPIQLTAAARKDGDVVRGAILFHQGNINCAKCHRPAAEKDRLGPDLSRIDADVTDASIIESILQPSKSIKQGFEAVMVLTGDGRTFNGIVVRDDATSLVIRDSQNNDRLITIAREDIDEIKPSLISSMPDGLGNELKSRQQFLDLLRYVIGVRERGPIADMAETPNGSRRELSYELNGLVLIQQMNCTACHAATDFNSIVDSRPAPRLMWSGQHLKPQFIKDFIADPRSSKPDTKMPHLLGRLDDDSRKKAAQALTHFIVSVANGSTTQRVVEIQPAKEGAERRGFELFHSVGCVACHSPRDESGNEIPLQDSIALGNLFRKYSPRGLLEFLENPHAVRPSGRMPNMQLTHHEATDLADYLLQSVEGTAESDFSVDTELAKQGKQWFVQLNCRNCHTEIASDIAQPKAHKTLAQLDAEQGCLSGAAGDWPSFNLNENDVTAIRSAIKLEPAHLTNEQQIQITLKSFNCIACHERGEFGGVTDARTDHFQTTNLNLGEQGRIPPALTGVGAKLNSKWMRDVLVNHRTIRPYMKTRMPQFGEDNIGHLINLFEETDKLPPTKFPQFDDQKTIRELGLNLAGNKGLNCVACHTYQYKLADTMPAVDLTEMTERLKKDWFHQYMLAPQKFSHNTVMPSFWPDGAAIRKDLEGDPDFQVEALWQYLLDGRQARMPSGVVREQLEIVVNNEAKMLRRSYPEIGKRGIGVGYPGGVNLAFDAEQLRLGMIWKGKFADPGGVWTGQGSGTVRPMAQPINFPKGPELDDASQPWIVDDGRPPQHHFNGYTLDKLQRPTFRFTFETVVVTDFFEQIQNEASDKTDFRRSVTMTSPVDRNDLRFRISEAKVIEAQDKSSFLIDGQLNVRIASNHQAIVINEGDQKQLRVLLDVNANEEEKLLIEYSWKQ